jgi:hypothetical protein
MHDAGSLSNYLGIGQGTRGEEAAYRATHARPCRLWLDLKLEDAEHVDGSVQSGDG